MFDIAVIPYRTLRFAGRYGFTVRDLMMLRALETAGDVSSITWFERPSLLIEKALARGDRPALANKTTAVTPLAINPIPALRYRRLWPAHALHIHDDAMIEWASQSTNTAILLDFHPFFIPDGRLLDRPDVFYWYDLIDDFTKHNVFTSRQRDAVTQKYDFVRKRRSFVTGVSDAAVTSFPGATTLPNRLLRSQWTAVDDNILEPEYDFGFTGFITDKFDVPFIRRLASLGYRILIRGKAYHKHIAAELAAIPGVDIGGEFHSKDQAAIIRQFRIGLIPYIPERCHEESPIKLLQYLALGRPSLISKRFGPVDEEFDRWVVVYEGLTNEQLSERITDLSRQDSQESLRRTANESNNIYWDREIDRVLRTIV